MKISAVETYLIRTPLKRPFKTALRTVDSIEDVVLRIVTDQGEQGFGEAPPTAVITGDTLSSVLGAVNTFIAPKLIGRDPADIEGNCAVVQKSMVHNTSAKAAVEMALYDLWGKTLNAPLYKLLGGAKQSLVTDVTISVNQPETMAADAAIAVNEGFTILKVKVGADPSLDLARLIAVRKAVDAIKPGIVLRADANQAWEPKQAIRIISQMEDAGIQAELVEQPVKGYDIEGLSYVTSHVQTPILADEALFSERDAAKLLSLHAADLLNIKLMKTGGISTALRIAAMAEAYGVKCMMGCMLEANVAVTAAAHVALAKGVITLIDLDGPALCVGNPVKGGAIFTGDTITMADAPGLGIAGIEGLLPTKAV